MPEQSQKPTKDIAFAILWALVIGVVVGLAIWWIKSIFEPGMGGFAYTTVDAIHSFVKTVGTLFVNALKMIVIPLVTLTLITSVANIHINTMGKFGIQTILLYVGTTAFAIFLALFFASVIQPGAGVNLASESMQLNLVEAPSLADVIRGIIPTNPINAMAEGQMLSVITFAILFGIALNYAGEKVEQLRTVISQASDVMLTLVLLIIKFAPIGVLCLVADVFARTGPNVFGNLALYFFTLLAVLVVQGFVVYPILLNFLGGLSPRTFYKKVGPVALFAFSTSSSNATIPVTLKVVTEDLGVNKRVSSLVVPLGATINMDGTAIMQGVATIFIAGAYGVDLSMGQLLTIILTVTLASIGTAGVPSAGLVMLTLVLEQAGLPLEAIGILLGVDRLLDMARTALNVCGDSLISCIIGRWNSEIDMGIFEGKT